MTVLEQNVMEANAYNSKRIADALERIADALENPETFESIAKSLEKLAGAVQTNCLGTKAIQVRSC